MKKLFGLLTLFTIISSHSYCQDHIGLSDKAIKDYFPTAEIHEIKMGDTLVVLALNNTLRAVFYYDIPREIITKYMINPMGNQNLLINIEDGLNKSCSVIKPGLEWQCKKNDFIIRVTKNKVEGPNNTMVNVFKYELEE